MAFRWTAGPSFAVGDIDARQQTHAHNRSRRTFHGRFAREHKSFAQQGAVPLPPENLGNAARPMQFQTNPTQPIGQRWYGWQMLATDIPLYVVDGIGTGLSFGGSGAGVPVATAASLGLLFSGPILHWVHGHVGRGFASLFGLRIGLPVGGVLVGGLIGLFITNPNSGPSGGSYAVEGALAGIALFELAGYIIDIAALAYDPIYPNATTASRRRRLPGLVAAPYISPTAQGWTAGLSGSF